MENYIIIRAGVNSGKTTTAGLLFEEIRKTAEYSKIFNYRLIEQAELEYNEHGGLYDFIGVLIINGKVIVIISRGDVAKDLEDLLDKLKQTEVILHLTSGRSNKIDLIICCARSQYRKGSTIEMLTKRIEEANSFEVWPDWSENVENKLSIKRKAIETIISRIYSL